MMAMMAMKTLVCFISIGVFAWSLRSINKDLIIYERLKVDDNNFRVQLDRGNGRMKVVSKLDRAVIMVGKADSEIFNTYILDKDKEEDIGCTYGGGEYIIKLCSYDDNKVELVEQHKITLNQKNSLSVFRGDGYYSKYDNSLDSLITELTVGDTYDIVTNTFKYVCDNIQYNDSLAFSIVNGNIVEYRPNLQEVISTKKGICIDQASLMATILRYKNIPTKIVTGTNESGDYHAWVEVYMGEKWLLYDPTLGINYKDSKSSSYKVCRYY